MSIPARRRPAATVRRGLLLALVLSAAPLTGCGTPPSSPPPSSPLPGPAPTWDATSRAAALSAARHGLALYARKDLSRAGWWSALAPHLSVSAAAAYRQSDPQAIPVTAVRGPARITAAPDPELALTQIPTDAGTYRVLVSRDSPTARWLIERITPPHYEGS